ncbi:MAG TPA: tripartite tricarboxylate transporter substrate binding protein [Xanthobacteraceae bacterium]|jgi:tripartite-type tricarboxylate transporter receptor subunit TctC
MIRHSIALLMLVFALLASETAHAQSWPQRPVKFVLPLGPGSGTDIGARLISDRLAARWGQPVVIENRPGGDGMVAISAFVGARDDHVLLFSPSSSFTAHPYLHENLPYKPSDLAPIARFSNTIISIAVPRSLRLDTLAQLFELARAQPGKLNWAGTTGATDFIFAGLAKRAGAEMTKVPYRNPVEAANDLGEGRVQAYASALAIVRPQLEAGKIRLLAVYNSVRAPTAPDIPTVAEAGFPEMTMDGLVGLFGPPEMPLDLRERIAGDVQAVSDASVAERLLTTGQILNTGGPAEFDAAVEEQRAKIAAIAKELAIKPGQ